PTPRVPAFRAGGGLNSASDNQRGFWNADGNNIQPRAGFAYQLDQQTVLRGGSGIYTAAFIIAGNFPPGFSQTTSLVPTLARGLPFPATLSNPFPAGVLAPSGSSRGADTLLAQD